MLLDFHLIRMLVSRLMTPGVGKGWIFMLLTLKLALVVTLIAAVFYRLPVSPMWFATGASTLLVAVVLDATVLGEPVVATDEQRETPSARG